MPMYDVSFKCTVYVEAPNPLDAVETAINQIDSGGWTGERDFLSVTDTTIDNPEPDFDNPTEKKVADEH